MYHPQYDKPFILRTNASINELVGVLGQLQYGLEVSICFISRVTKDYVQK